MIEDIDLNNLNLNEELENKIIYNKWEEKDLLFTPLDQDDFLPGNHGAEYLNEVIWLLIENTKMRTQKPTIENAVKKAFVDYGECLKKLGNE